MTHFFPIDLLVIISVIFVLTKLDSILPVLSYWWLCGLSFIHRPRDDEVAHLDENDSRKKHFFIAKTSDPSKEKKIPLTKNLIFARWGVLNVRILSETYKSNTLRFVTLLTEGVLCGYFLHFLLLLVKYFFNLSGSYQTSSFTTYLFLILMPLLCIVVMREVFSVFGEDSMIWKLSVIVGLVGVVVSFFVLDDPEFLIDIPLIRGFEQFQDSINTLLNRFNIPFEFYLPNVILRIVLSLVEGVLITLHFLPVFQTTALHFRTLQHTSTVSFLTKGVPYIMWFISLIQIVFWFSPVVDFLESYRDEEVEERENVEVAYRTNTTVGWILQHLVKVLGMNIYHRLRLLLGSLHLFGHALLIRSSLQAKLLEVHHKIKLLLSINGSTRYKIGPLIQNITSNTLKSVSYFALLVIIVPLFQFWLLFFNGYWVIDFLYFSSLIISTLFTTIFFVVMQWNPLTDSSLVTTTFNSLHDENEHSSNTSHSSSLEAKKRTPVKTLNHSSKSVTSSSTRSSLTNDKNSSLMTNSKTSNLKNLKKQNIHKRKTPSSTEQNQKPRTK